MASFQVVSCEVPSCGGAGDRMLQRVWTITSKRQLQTLHVKVPGVVFVDYDSSLNPEDASEPSAPDTTAAAAKENVVAKIVVTTDSSPLLELLEVAPLDLDKETKGVRFHVKNQNAALQCSVLTQIFVRGKCALHEFDSNGSDVVLGDDVLVQEDPEAEVKVTSRRAGDVFLSSVRGFSLGSFVAQKIGDGSFQIRTPSLEATHTLNLSAGGDGNATMFVAAEKIRAKSIIALAIRSQHAVVETRDLATEMLMIWSLQGGFVTFSGHGTATTAVNIALGNGTINTVDIVAETAMGSLLFGGTVLTRATKELRAFAVGPGSIKFAGDRPEVVKESTWFRWKWIFGDFVAPFSPSENALQLCKPREQPPRQPKAVHFRVKKAYFGKEPKLEIGRTSVFGLSKVTLLSGAAVFVVVGVVVAKCKHRENTRAHPGFEVHQQGEAQVVDRKVAVASDSTDLLESLELAPLQKDRQDQGVKFRVKNQSAELRRSTLTRVFWVYGRARTVLVQDDPEVDITLAALSSASLSLSEGLSLQSLDVLVHGTGTFQLQAPFTRILDTMVLTARWKARTLAVSADITSAKQINSVVVVPARPRSADVKLDSRQDALRRRALWIHSSGYALVVAAKVLEASSPFFGTIEYTQAEPEVIKQESTWLWWRNAKSQSDIVKPAAISGTMRNAVKPYKFRDPPRTVGEFQTLVREMRSVQRDKHLEFYIRS